VIQLLTLLLAVSRRDANVVLHKRETSPMLSINHLVIKTTAGTGDDSASIAAVTCQNFPAQRTDLTRHAIGDAQLIGAEMSPVIFAGQRLRQLGDQTRNHSC